MRRVALSRNVCPQFCARVSLALLADGTTHCLWFQGVLDDLTAAVKIGSSSLCASKPEVRSTVAERFRQVHPCRTPAAS